jgi:uncharacterized protein
MDRAAKAVPMAVEAGPRRLVGSCRRWATPLMWVAPRRSGQYGRETLMAGKFVLKKGSTGKFHFNLHAANGQVIATSEAYNSKESALNGIESVKKNAPDAPVEDETSD